MANLPPKLDGAGATNAATSVSSIAATITTSNSNDIILAFVHAVSTGAAGSAATVTGVADGLLTWARRGSIYFGASAPYNTLELWWAAATNPVSSLTVTASLSETIDACSIQLIAVSGCESLTNPWDTSTFLPATFGTTTNIGAPQLQITTVNSNTMLLGLFATYSNTGTVYPGSQTGFKGLYDTTIQGTNYSETLSEYQYASGMLINPTYVSFGGIPWTTPDWVVLFDALVGDPGPTNIYLRAGQTPSSTIKLLNGGASINGQAVTVATSSAVGVVKQVDKAIPVTTSSAVSVVKQAGKVVAVAVSSAVTAAKAVGKVVAVPVSSAITAVKAVGKAVAVPVSSAVGAAKSTGKAVAVSCSSAVGVAKQAGKNVAVAVSSSVAMAKLINKLVGVAASSAVVVTTTTGQVYTQLVSVSVSTTVTVATTINRFAFIASRAAMRLYGAMSAVIAWGSQNKVDLD